MLPQHIYYFNAIPINKNEQQIYYQHIKMLCLLTVTNKKTDYH